jgi:hypothetical protein
MSLRLRLASLWMPRFIMAREVERIRSSTNASLDALLAEHVPDVSMGEREGVISGLAERRSVMARGHERRIMALVKGVGRERAISLGREALLRTGMEFGKDAKERLGVNETKDDLIRAARVLYRILGIEFMIVAGPEGERIEVTRCAISLHYSPETCAVLSAVDEGAISGMSPKASMRFQKYITDGSTRCVAMIDFGEER